MTMGGFDLSHLALNTATLGHNVGSNASGWPTERLIDECAARCISGLVFWRREIGNNPHEVGCRVRAAGLTVAGLCRTPYLVGPEAPERGALESDLIASVDMAAELGAGALTIVVGGVEPGTNGIRPSLSLVTDRLRRLCEIAEGSGVRLALEPLHPNYAADRCCLVTTRDAMEICEAIDSPALGVAIDAYHVWWDTQLEDQLRHLPRERLLGFHICDWLRNQADPLLDRGMMGEGVIDLRQLADFVWECGYRSFAEVEIFSSNNWWKRPVGETLDCVVEAYRRTIMREHNV